jgi:hypothetical protein
MTGPEPLRSEDASEEPRQQAEGPTARDGADAPPDEADAPDAGDADDTSQLPDRRAGLRVPRRHVAQKEVCGAERPAVNAPCPHFPWEVPDAAFACPCGMDSDCTEGINPRCTYAASPCCPRTECTSDECFSDDDCPSGLACDCRGRHFEEAPAMPNHCLTVGNCRVDADCPESYCSPSKVDGCMVGWAVGLFCHTADDECVDDEDCSDGGQVGACTFDSASKHWICSFGMCADA